MTRTLGLLIAIGLVLGSGIAHGLWTERWQKTDHRQLAADRVKELPLNVGNWTGEAKEMADDEVKAARIDGYVMRHYVRSGDGRRVSLLLMCGRPGPLSVHTPDICYEGTGHAQVKPAVKNTIACTDASLDQQFWMADFMKEYAWPPSALRIRWAWSRGGSWQAPDNPRLTFAGSSVLYKLYVIVHMDDVKESEKEDPGNDFIRALLPELQKIMQ